MVDAVAHFSRMQANPAAHEAYRHSTHSPAVASIPAADYSRQVAGTTVAPAQTPNWVTAWSETSGADTFIVMAGPEQGPHIILPLEVVRKGPFRVARLMGGSHAAGNFPAFRDGPGRLTAEHLAQSVRASRSDVDLLHLERLCPELGGVSSPLAALPHTESPNLALAVSLEGGFEALLDRASGKRKRKKHRSQARKFEAAGGLRRIEARSPEEIDAILARFYEMKADRFRKMGIADVFAADGVRAFFRRLFVDALSQSPPPFVLHGLEVGGKLRAVTGSSRSGDRLICEFGAITEDELAFASPGEFLFYENIREACEQGLGIYDFSVGDEHYKRLWCNIEIHHFDIAVPISAKGRVLAAALGGITAAKRVVKQNPVVWALVKRLRRKAAAPAPAEDDRD